MNFYFRRRWNDAVRIIELVLLVEVGLLFLPSFFEPILSLEARVLLSIFVFDFHCSDFRFFTLN
jgi:hypothetical protein